jgi:hypothetical protein
MSLSLGAGVELDEEGHQQKHDERKKACAGRPGTVHLHLVSQLRYATEIGTERRL